MKTLLTVILAVILTLMCVGIGKWQDSRYERLVFHEIARAGDTLDTIAEHYYNPASDKRSWQEFRYDVMDRNKIHFANNRCLQIGDIVCIEVWVKK